MENLPAYILSGIAVIIALLGRTNAGVANFAKLQTEHDTTKKEVDALKTAIIELSKATTQMAVLQTLLSTEQKEMERTRERLHDHDGLLRGLLAWRETLDPNYGRRERT